MLAISSISVRMSIFNKNYIRQLPTSHERLCIAQSVSSDLCHILSSVLNLNQINQPALIYLLPLLLHFSELCSEKCQITLRFRSFWSSSVVTNEYYRSFSFIYEFFPSWISMYSRILKHILYQVDLML